MNYFFLPFLLFWFHFSLAQPIVYVTPTGSGDNSGTSWTNALPGTLLASRLNTASPNTQFWLTGGMYKPAIYEMGQSFNIFRGNKLYGGFLGNETSIEQRITNSVSTTLSGDIGDLGSRYDNTWHVIQASTYEGLIVIDGITVVDGYAGPQLNFSGGGGALISGGNILIKNCIFQNNGAYHYGGGIRFEAHSGGCVDTAYVENCQFLNNSGKYGGAVYSDGMNGCININFKDCLFNKNNNFSNMTVTLDSGFGGAVCNNAVMGESNLTFINCHFSQNIAAGGGAVNALTRAGTSRLGFTNCLFYGNTARYNSALVIDCVGINNSACRSFFTNCSFIKNKATHKDGCTIGMYTNDSTTTIMKIYNSIFWSNDGDQTFDDDELPTYHQGKPELAYNYIDTFENYKNSGSNIYSQQSPFVNAEAGNFHLKPKSPAIDAGSNKLTPLPRLDFRGRPRIINQFVDLGIYEFDCNDAIQCQPFIIRRTQ